MTQFRFEDDAVSEVRQRLDIVDVVSQFVVLRRMGQNFRGLCPFHQEKSPSFYVHPEKGIFRCFGCGVGGNVFNFLMRIENKTFGEVLREQAERVGIALGQRANRSEHEESRSLIKRINKMAGDFYQWVLQHPQYGEIGRAYLKQRGVSPEMQKRFTLGFAQNSWDGLYRYLTGQGFSPEQVEEAGLIIPRPREDGHYDRFRYRLMFPIANEQGEVIAFGGRALEENTAKYINSPETPLYTKGNHVYALHLAKDAIRQQDRVLLMEGYLDVLTAHQFGFEHAVAGLGTALTPQQAKQLLRYCPSKQVIMAYDADRAGQNAADRGIQVLEEVAQGTGVGISVLQIPDGKDPDEFLHKQGKEAFAELLQNPLPLMEFQLQQVLKGADLRNPKGRADAALQCGPILDRIRDPIYRDECIKHVLRLGVSETALRQYLARQQQPHWQRRGARTLTPGSINRHKTYQAEQTLLIILAEEPTRRPQILSELGMIPFQDPLHEDIHQLIVRLHRDGKQFGWAELLDQLSHLEVQSRLTEMMENKPYDEQSVVPSLVNQCLATIRQHWLELELKRIESDIIQAGNSGNHTLVSELMQKQIRLKESLLRERQEAREQAV